MIYDEIIIGAGIAGLYWCYKTKPKNFIIVEKSNRIGGRIHNIDWNGHHISLGGGVIKSSNTHTINLCNELELELTESTNKYHMIDLETETENINKPNENNFYESNKIIIKYLKKIFNLNKKIIQEQKLNWNEFLNLFLDHKTSTIIKSNLLYKTYSDANIESVLTNEIDELLRTNDFKIWYIKNLGYTELLNKLLEPIPKTNIITDCEINQINLDSNGIYNLISTQNQTLKTKKIIFATESKNNIKFNISLSIDKKITNLYNMFSGTNYIRIYSYHKSGHKLNCSYRTNGLPGKVIMINDNILMCSYTENYQAVELYNLLNKNDKKNQINIIHNLLLKSNINITKPDDLVIKFWVSGTHFDKPEFNFDKKKQLLVELKKQNIYIIGECISNTHGWVDSALESVDFVLDL